MAYNKLFDQVQENIDTVIRRDTPLGVLLWKEFLRVHPADIAQFLSSLEHENIESIFKNIPQEQQIDIFEYVSDSMKGLILSFSNSQLRAHLLASLPLDELTDFFDELSDDDLKKYLKLLHKQERDKVLSLMQFDPESAGGMMDTDILSFKQSFTVEKCIQILQRLQPRKDLHQDIFITDKDHRLVGYIKLEDLVLHHPQTRISSFIKELEYIADVDQDQQDVAQKMTHYKLTIAPVVNKENVFLGVIPSDTLVDILEQEAAEDVYRISAVRPIRQTYFETPFFTLFYQRASILTMLLLLQTFSSVIIQYYEATLFGFLSFFITMLTSTGGNTSSQTSALVIQGITSGDIQEHDMPRFLWREFKMSLMIASSLACISFIRVFLTHPHEMWGNVAVSLSLGSIVMLSVMLGSFIPLILKRFKMDPALSAGPFLATIMDILGLLVYCLLSQLILGSAGVV
jgi:magnesium transporter